MPSRSIRPGKPSHFSVESAPHPQNSYASLSLKPTPRPRLLGRYLVATSCSELHVLTGPGPFFDEFAVLESCAGSDQRDEVGCVHSAPPGLCGLDELEGHRDSGGAGGFGLIPRSGDIARPCALTGKRRSARLIRSLGDGNSDSDGDSMTPRGAPLGALVAVEMSPRQRDLPRLTVRRILAPEASFVPGVAACETTRPFATRGERIRTTLPGAHAYARRSMLARASGRLRTLGTRQPAGGLLGVPPAGGGPVPPAGGGPVSANAEPVPTARAARIVAITRLIAVFVTEDPFSALESCRGGTGLVLAPGRGRGASVAVSRSASRPAVSSRFRRSPRPDQ